MIGVGWMFFLNEVLHPLFNSFEAGYDDFKSEQDEFAKSGIKEIQDVGSFTLSDAYQLKIFDITVYNTVSLSRNKSAIQKVIRKYIRALSGALMFFHYENPKDRQWRLSYVATGISKNEDTSARRYT